MQTTNFNREHVQRPYQPRRVPYVIGHLFVYVGCLLVVWFGWWAGSKVYRISTSYRQMSTQLTALPEVLASGDPVALEAALRQAIAGLETVTDELEPLLPLTPYLSWLPVYGPDIQALPVLVPLGREVGRVGEPLLAAVSPLLEAQPAVEPMPHLVAALTDRQVELAAAEAALRQHQVRLATIEPDRLSARLGPPVAQLQQNFPRLLLGLKAARYLPQLLGGEEPRTYLLLTQNADEIRPGGGYITAAGHVTLAQGRIVEFVMQDSYAVDHLSAEYPYPPDPIYRYMAADYWVLRDVSWSPDFPTMATHALGLYALGQGVTAEGVIALDQHALPLLLAAVGPVSVEGESVTAANVITLMRQHWAPADNHSLDAAWWVQRKSFMLDLAETLRHQLEQEAKPAELGALLPALRQAIAEKHVQLYFNDPTGVELLTQAHAAGSLAAEPGDFLMVVDANLGFNKASAVVERHSHYAVTLAADGSAASRVELSYHHPAPARTQACSQEPRYDPVYEHNMARCYWNYVRLVVPAGAELQAGPAQVVDGRFLLRGQATSGQSEVERLPHDKLGWGQLFLLAPAESLSLSYGYRLPPGTAISAVAEPGQSERRTYTLTLPKQPGTLAPPVTVDLTLPEGATLRASQPGPISQQGHRLSYRLELDRDYRLRVTYDLSRQTQPNLLSVTTH